MNPWLSWAVVLGAAGALWWHYTRNKKTQPARPRSNTGSEGPQFPKQTKKEERARRKPASDLSGSDNTVASAVKHVAASASDNLARRKGGKNTQASFTSPSSTLLDEKDDESSDRQWAEQLSQARKGTNLSMPTSDASRTRTVKASASNTSPDFSSASSNGGADADDDMTPAMSPALKAGDISDMLEPKKAGPSVLRLTEPTNPMPQRAPRPQKEFQVAETKKQRQNRRKNEERKVANQDIEKERQALLEKQRRSAREARGEPAKNGLQQSAPPASNAWTSKPQAEAIESRSDTAPPVQPLLDTFQPNGSSTIETAIAPANGGYHGNMTEEEQFRLVTKISSDEDGWNTVAAKKGKKATDVPAAKAIQHSSASSAPRVANGYAALPDEE
ncbi:hypothetical protein ANO11243_057250 [Dothideomycetidae sp. 11243]|nr:hypothetical protein ANO11243_057250 [fungal sp. No.11243]